MGKETILYAVRQLSATQFVVSKLGEDFIPSATYNIFENPKSGALACDCPAYKPWCRHCDILRKFQAEGRINSGWFYNFDTKEWIPPLAHSV